MTYNPFSLDSKTILVTGASSGIGRAVALECAKAGAKVIINGRDEGRLRETLEALEGEGHRSWAADISTEQGRQSLLAELPALDGIVHAAGIGKQLPFKFVNQTEMDRIFAANFFAPVLLTQQLVKNKKLTKGCSVVMLSSIAGNLCVYMGNSMYAASKSALSGISRSMALELAVKNIRVNCILPGMVETPLIHSFTDEQLADDVKKYPLGRYGKPEEIAYAAIYFLSDASVWVTGSQLVIDGGFTLQ